MKQFLAGFWYLYIMGGYIIVILLNAKQLPFWALYIVISIGLLFYIAKLYYINNCTIFELNWRTLLFDLMYYLYYILLAFIVWYVLYMVTKYALPEPYYSRAFPRPTDFFNWARQWVFVSALIGLSNCLASSLNHHIISFKFTNKVAIMEVLRVLIALLWVCIFPTYVFIFISFTAFNTMPEHVKRWLSRWLSWWFKRDIDLLKQNIQNNAPDNYPRIELKYLIKDIIIVPFLADLPHQLLPLSVIMLLMFIVGENFFFLLRPTPPLS